MTIIDKPGWIAWGDGEARHGTRGMYNQGCRCAYCKFSQWEYSSLLRRARTPTSHGLSGYNNYGCRCGDCVAAKADDNALRRSA